MKLLQRFNDLRHQKPLGVKLLTSILLYSSVITLVATGTQLWLDYRYERSAIDVRIQQIEASSLNSLANSLWEISPTQIQVQLDGLLQLPDIQYLEIQSHFNNLYTAGEKPHSGAIVERHFSLIYSDNSNEAVKVGDLTLIVGLDEVYRRLADKVLLILASQGIKTFLVSIFILTLFNQLITRHLSTMAEYAQRLKLDQLDTPLILKRKPRQKEDELSQVVNSMNGMRQSMLVDMGKREDAERSLARLNAELEQRVSDRTQELEQSNDELRETLLKLQETQQQLVESKNLAALGSLVAGVAHEINTPIGIGYTAASFLADQAKLYQKENQLDPLANTAVETSQLICQNLERATQLISAFKLVSVDQASEQRRHFDLIEYIQEILHSLKPKLKQTNPEITILGPEQLLLDSYPGSYYQIFTNLILNSLLHGFESRPGGKINIEVKTQGNRLIVEYRDNGIGIPNDWHTKLFEPFMTTKRNQGCSGLGMHIVFNLVNQLLQGNIRCLPSTEGAYFHIDLPQIPETRNAHINLSKVV